MDEQWTDFENAATYAHARELVEKKYRQNNKSGKKYILTIHFFISLSLLFADLRHHSTTVNFSECKTRLPNSKNKTKKSFPTRDVFLINSLFFYTDDCRYELDNASNASSENVLGKISFRTSPNQQRSMKRLFSNFPILFFARFALEYRSSVYISFKKRTNYAFHTNVNCE